MVFFDLRLKGRKTSTDESVRITPLWDPGALYRIILGPRGPVRDYLGPLGPVKHYPGPYPLRKIIRGGLPFSGPTVRVVFVLRYGYGKYYGNVLR